MKNVQKAAPLRYYYQLLSDTCISPRRPFVCADCRRSLQKEIRAPPQRRHASSCIRGSAHEGHIFNHTRLSNGSKQYHKSSKHAAGVEHHTTPNPDEAFLSLGESSHAQQDEQKKKTASSIRQRLRQWREENDTPLTIPGGADLKIPKGLGVTSTQIPIPGPNSIGPEEDLNNSAGDELEDYDPNPLGDYQDDWAASTSLMNPGDLAEIGIPGASGSSESLCILVRLVNGQGQFITSKGYWYASATHQLKSGKIQNFISPDKLEPLTPYLPDEEFLLSEIGTLPIPVSKVGDIPIEVAAPIVNQLVQLEQDINAFQRMHTLAFDGLYETLADDEDLVEWQLGDLVLKVFGIPYSEISVAGLLAIDRFSAQRAHGVYPSRLSGKTEAYWVRSRQDMRMMKQVMDWARMYQESAARAALGKDVKEELRRNPLGAFINKAHRLIRRSRKIRSPTTIGLLGPSSESGNGGAITAVETGETLTRTDKLITRFIFESSQMMPPLVPCEAHSICALIYRAIGAYPNLTLGRKVARLFLQELGVISPWHDRGTNMYQIRLPGLGIWPYQERLLARAEASCKDLSVFRDSVQHARKDWGQMPVYCIDSAQTVEIDDGISIERDVNMLDCAWIHVHIANPAAYISPDHPIATAAKDILSSTYTPTRKYSMMPPTFTQRLSSLAADRPVMTISTLLRADGSVVDIEVSLGIVHNVVRLTPSVVDDALEEYKREQATMVIGGGETPAQDQADSEALKQALPDLLLMRQFLYHRFEKRLHEWPAEERMKKEMRGLRISSRISLKEASVPLSSDKITHWKGDPVIVVEGDRFPRTQGDFDFIPFVDHVMLLAGESAGKWCKERGIPILYHVATPHPLFPVSKLNQLDETEYRLEPRGRLSVTPQPHWSICMWQYTRITSPIRRYTDLVNQWQIQAYLQAASRASQDPENAGSLEPLSELPFTWQELDDCIRTFSGRLPAMKRIGQTTAEHIIHQAFFRAFHFKEAELPEVWDFKVIGPQVHKQKAGEGTGIIGHLSPFHARAELVFSEQRWEKDVGRGQYLPVRIEVVDAEEDKIFVKAVGLPSDDPTTTGPIHIRSSKKAVSAVNEDLEQ